MTNRRKFERCVRSMTGKRQAYDNLTKKGGLVNGVWLPLAGYGSMVRPGTVTVLQWQGSSLTGSGRSGPGNLIRTRRRGPSLAHARAGSESPRLRRRRPAQSRCAGEPESVPRTRTRWRASSSSQTVTLRPRAAAGPGHGHSEAARRARPAPSQPTGTSASCLLRNDRNFCVIEIGICVICVMTF